MLFDKRELSSADVLDSDTGGSGRTGRADYYRLQGVGTQYAILISVNTPTQLRLEILTTTGRHLWILSASLSSHPFVEKMLMVSLESSAHSRHRAVISVGRVEQLQLGGLQSPD